MLIFPHQLIEKKDLEEVSHNVNRITYREDLCHIIDFIKYPFSHFHFLCLPLNYPTHLRKLVSIRLRTTCIPFINVSFDSTLNTDNMLKLVFFCILRLIKAVRSVK